MRAVEPDVLTEALHVQEALLGPTSGSEYLRSGDGPAPTPGGRVVNDRSAAPASFFHSPLLYWNCSATAIEADSDLLDTINERSHRVSSVNLTLRHSTVFAGKQFSRDRLIAADALVITFFHRMDPEIGELWNSRAEKLAKDATGSLTLYPANGKVKRFRLYEFRFEPMSLREDVLLGVAYLLMVLYVILNLRKLRAVKSKLGLVATVIAQVFQLINAVLMTPPEVPTITRISSAIGNIGHLALARAAQNLFILWVLGKVVWVTAFCVFSSIALVFDLFFHLTFFLAVLSVEVQRMDLQDSLDRVNPAQGRSMAVEAGKQRWIDSLLLGRIPFSSRIAGTAIMICFVTALNWHFFDNEIPFQSLSRLMNIFRRNESIRASEAQATLTVSVNQARSPTSWLRLQDHDTAKEVIRLVKPRAHSLVAQVYDPLVFVIKGANRDQPSGGKTLFSHSHTIIPEIPREHILPFALLLVLVVALVTLLMNYLLWNEAPDDTMEIADVVEPVLSVKTYGGEHTLDIVMLSSSASGALVSVGLDRQIVVWNLTTGWSSNVTEKFRQLEVGELFWPITALALDDDSNWLAICSRSGLVSFLNLQHLSAAQFVHIDLREHQPSAFCFASERDSPSAKLITVKADGWVIEIDPLTLGISKQKTCDGKIISANALLIPKPPLRVFTATKFGCICSIVCGTNDWEGRKFDAAEPDEEGFLPMSGILPLPALGMLLAIGHCEVKLVDSQLSIVIHRFKTSQIKANSLRVIHSQRRQCPTCTTGYGVSSFSILYTESETHDFIMHTLIPKNEQRNVICLNATEYPTESRCQGFAGATQTLHRMHGAGIWEATTTNNVIGVRRKAACSQVRNHSALRVSPRSKLRRRGARERETANSADGDYEWEAWTMSAGGEVNTSPISTKSAHSELFVSKVGPISKVGKCSVAVGFGNTIKLLVAGNERFDSREGVEDFPFATVGHRRRMQTRKSQ
ncbi:hypothetical protein GP486_004634 [Trichoglossum hirsutum]|uniref:Sterol regulatory element-binding protein cleavage-activating protein n=1 Tax=Trichoglossum hirsutum TaxID=265104 RepID=A0A9P8LAT7_9PEZI|nr:hypothetical protein GP486_004634 [Trichoglossum hirsutum]